MMIHYLYVRSDTTYSYADVACAVTGTPKPLADLSYEIIHSIQPNPTTAPTRSWADRVESTREQSRHGKREQAITTPIEKWFRPGLASRMYAPLLRPRRRGRTSLPFDEQVQRQARSHPLEPRPSAGQTPPSQRTARRPAVKLLKRTANCCSVSRFSNSLPDTL